MKTLDEIDRIMKTMPEEWRTRWCGGEYGPCACMGCVQIGNRIIMYEKATGAKFLFDPEHINESDLPGEILEKYKITHQEWLTWLNAKHTLPFNP